MSKRYHHFDNTCILQSYDSGPVELLRESENGCLPSPLSLKPNHLIHDSIPAASCRPVRQPGVAFWKESIAIMKICRTLPKGISMLEAMCGLQGTFSVAHNAFLEFVQETGVDSGRPLACSGNALRMERSLAPNPQQQVFASLGQAALETLG
jgi:hypothetical protein